MGDALDKTSTPHNVWVSDFTCEEKLVTWTLWQQVCKLAMDDYGYTFGPGPNGKADDHPVQMVTWYNAIAWCNGRSEVEGIPPCYRSGDHGDVIRSGSPDNRTDNVLCDFHLPGYRLLTEAEWEKMARGGVEGQRFPNGNHIDQKTANYFGQTYWPYDDGPSGHDPRWNKPDVRPYTSPVGSFAPNKFGVFDAAGNVSEWVWDWFDKGYYAYSPQADPQGPDGPGDPTAPARVIRGGGWNMYASNCRCCDRGSCRPGSAFNYLGFRCLQNRL